MGRVASAAHFIKVVEGLEQPRSTPYEALILMRIIDAVYKSAAQLAPVVFT
jgi:predicted dehydrogenase